MKSRGILFQGLVGTGRGSKSPETLAFSTLFCWQMRHIFVYCMMSSCIFGQKYPFLNKAYVRCHPWCPAHKVSWHSWMRLFLSSPVPGTYNLFPFVIRRSPSTQNCRVFPALARPKTVVSFQLWLVQRRLWPMGLYVNVLWWLRFDASILLDWIWANMHRAACFPFWMSASASWLLFPILCSNLKSNLANDSCYRACFAVNFSWSKKWQMALLSVFTTNCDPKRYYLQTRRQWTTANISFPEIVYLLSASLSFRLS